jgi:hypothetical protein
MIASLINKGNFCFNELPKKIDGLLKKNARRFILNYKNLSYICVQF